LKGDTVHGLQGLILFNTLFIQQETNNSLKHIVT